MKGTVMPIEVIGIKFATSPAKSYFFLPINNEKFKIGDSVVAETSRGLEFGEVTIENKFLQQTENSKKLRSITRRATNKDFQTHHENKKKEKEAAEVAGEKAKLHNLDMTILSAHLMLDRSKILFYFTSDNRVDFRDLVKTLASTLHTRIELRQIGVRDEARLLGGIDSCGRPLCCSTFLEEFAPISVKNAKEQGLSLNPTKISGSCGRLLCCLKYEEKAYEELNAIMPGIGAIVTPKEGPLKDEKGIVENMYVIRSLIKVKFEKRGETHIMSAKDVNILQKGRLNSDEESIENLKEIE